MDIVEQIVEKLGLIPLAGEGGFFRETYRSQYDVRVSFGQKDKRNLGTVIYYLITKDEFSALHRLKSDEIFHFYLGDPVEMIQINDRGEFKKIQLGPNVLEGHQVQIHVPAGTWQGTQLCPGGKFALLGTSVFPGFDFSDFDLGIRKELIQSFPELSQEIIQYTRN